MLERNWRCRYGELDIIAVDGSVLVVVEVKTRASRMYTDPAEAVTRTNWPRCGVPRGCGWRSGRRGFQTIRFDVIAIQLDPVDPTDLTRAGCVITSGVRMSSRVRALGTVHTVGLQRVRGQDAGGAGLGGDGAALRSWSVAVWTDRCGRHAIVFGRQSPTPGFKFPEGRLTVALSPADIPKSVPASTWRSRSRSWCRQVNGPHRLPRTVVMGVGSRREVASGQGIAGPDSRGQAGFRAGRRTAGQHRRGAAGDRTGGGCSRLAGAGGELARR